MIKLQQVDADTFRAYLFWIHGRKIAFNVNFARQGISASDLYPTSLALAKLWLLADRLTTTKLRNDVMEALSRLLVSVDPKQGNPTDIFPPSMTVLIWPATTSGRSLRRLVLDYYAKVPIPVIEEHVAEHQPDFVQELLQKIVEDHEGTQSNLPTTQSNGDPPSEDAAPSPPQPLGTVAQPPNLPATAIGVNVILKDKLGKVLHAKGARIATPSCFTGAILRKLQGQAPGNEQSQQASVEVTLQFPDNTSQPVDTSSWSESFEKVSLPASAYIQISSLQCDIRSSISATASLDEEPLPSSSTAARSPRTWATRAS